MSTEDTRFDPERENPEAEDQQGQEANPEAQGPDLEPGEAHQPRHVDLRGLQKLVATRLREDPEFARLVEDSHEGLDEDLDALEAAVPEDEDLDAEEDDPNEDHEEDVERIPPYPFNRGILAGAEWAEKRATPSELERLAAFMHGSHLFLRKTCNAERLVFMINPEAATDHESAMRYWRTMAENLECLRSVEYDIADPEFQTGFLSGACMLARGLPDEELAVIELGWECGENWASTRARPEELRQLLRFDECIGLEQIFEAEPLGDEEFIRMMVLLVTPPSSGGLMAWRETWQRMVGRWVPRPNPWTVLFAASFIERAARVARGRRSA